LALKLLDKLGIASLFETVIPQGKEDVHWAVMAQVLIVCRFCDPSSELYIAEHLYERTVLSDLLGLPCDKLNDDRLYRALGALLPHKQALEVHLKERLGELFNLKYDLLLYDVTSTYFESRDKRGDCKQVCIGLEVKCCSSPDGQETYILCRSEDRAQKEKAILERFEKRIEEGLSKIEASCLKRKYKLVTIAKSVGRLLGQNARAAGLFKTGIFQDRNGRTRLRWKKIESWRDWAGLSEGCYLLRSNINDWTGEELWRAYMQLAEAEAAFRIHKSDLRIRPIWRQKQERVEAHILVCFLAYVLWKNLGQLCRRGGLGDEPRRVLDELKRFQVVDVVLPTRKGITLRRRCVTKPTDHQAILLQHLGFVLPSRLPIMEKRMDEM